MGCSSVQRYGTGKHAIGPCNSYRAMFSIAVTFVSLLHILSFTITGECINTLIYSINEMEHNANDLFIQVIYSGFCSKIDFLITSENRQS